MEGIILRIIGLLRGFGLETQIKIKGNLIPIYVSIYIGNGFKRTTLLRLKTLWEGAGRCLTR